MAGTLRSCLTESSYGRYAKDPATQKVLMAGTLKIQPLKVTVYRKTICLKALVNPPHQLQLLPVRLGMLRKINKKYYERSLQNLYVIFFCSKYFSIFFLFMDFIILNNQSQSGYKIFSLFSLLWFSYSKLQNFYNPSCQKCTYILFHSSVQIKKCNWQCF